MKVRPLAGTACALGESPVWSAREGALYWVDVTAPALCRWAPADGQSVRRWSFEKPLAAVAPTSDERLLLVFRSRMALFDPRDGALAVLPVQPLDPDERFNDGACDARGRFWVGTFDRTLQRPMGRLYCLERGALRCSDEGFQLSNGIAFSPEQDSMYFADTRAGHLHVYAFDEARGILGPRRTLVSYAGDARPDGCTVDAAGHLWVAMVRGACLLKLDPRGEVLERVALPLSQPTSCAFGGPQRKSLYVTSMRHGMQQGALASQPLAGSVLVVEETGEEGARDEFYVHEA